MKKSQQNIIRELVACQRKRNGTKQSHFFEYHARRLSLSRASLFLIFPSSPPTETHTKEFRRAPSIIGISGEIAEGTVLERQVGRCGGLPRRTHASEVDGEEWKKKNKTIPRERKRARSVMWYTYIVAPTSGRTTHIRTRACTSTYVLACFCPGCFLMLLCPPRRSYRGSRVVSLELYVCVG